MPTQRQMCANAERKMFDLNAAMLELLYGTNPLSDDDLRKLIDRRPEKYGRFSGYIGKRTAAAE